MEIQAAAVDPGVEDLAAYTDALEEFLDEEGTAQQLLDSEGLHRVVRVERRGANGDGG